MAVVVTLILLGEVIVMVSDDTGVVEAVVEIDTYILGVLVLL